MAEQMVTILDRENTLLNRFIAQMRDVNIQVTACVFVATLNEPER